jgi:hypothetical protein
MLARRRCPSLEQYFRRGQLITSRKSAGEIVETT